MNVKEINKAKDIKWYIFFGALLIILGTYNYLFSITAFIYISFLFFIFTKNDSLCLIMFIMPFANIFKISPRSQSFFTFITVLYVFYNIFIYRKIKLKFLILYIIFIFFLFMQMFISIDISRFIKFSINILLIYFALKINLEKDVKRILIFYVMGIIISSLLVFSNINPNLVNYIGEKSLAASYSGLTRFSGLYADPNYYSINVIISSCLLIILYYTKEISKVFFLTGIALLFLFSIKTYSKSAILMLSVPILLFLYLTLKKREFIIFVIFCFILSIFIVKVLSGKINILKIVLLRLNTDNLDSLTTGRFSLWIEYLDYLIKNPKVFIIGKGLGASLLFNRAAHNTYIECLYYLGIIGSSLFLCNLLMIFKISKLKINRNILNYSILICILTMYFFLGIIFYFDFAFQIIIAYYIYNLPIKNKFSKNQ